ncbi:hypothetical protein [Halorubellus salinus]|uniref:hypothetical protein n=1 Tax=Halorubellus salinus TaxID=755309 RepID=UPI001D08E9F6|nr:hypothetical protein [Halorubellus salinus]
MPVGSSDGSSEFEGVSVCPGELPGKEPDELTAAVETVAEQQSELTAEALIWVARARDVVAERTAAQETLEAALDAVSELDTDRSRLEKPREALREVEQRERKHQQRAERIDENARSLGSDDDAE